MPDAGQLVHHLLLLELQLLLIGEGLPFAPAASPVMVAERRYAQWGRLHHIYRHTLHIAAFLPVHTDIHHITGDSELDEKDLAIHPGQRISLSRYRLNLNIVQHQFIFFTHILTV